MNYALIENLRDGFQPTGSIRSDVPAFLTQHKLPKIAAHVAAVAAEARRIAILAQVDPDRAEIAGWLHDVSAVIPSVQRADVARQWGVEVLPEEDAYPMILHQKLSVVLGREVFGVMDEDILSAVGCHTTLRPAASLLDKAVFVADKIAWDQEGQPPFLVDLLAGLDRSVDQAALAYLRYLWERRASLKVIHPWLAAAYEQLVGEVIND
jgi:predicted HD superfamily hydrolase involved in NAD metabolism